MDSWTTRYDGTGYPKVNHIRRYVDRSTRELFFEVAIGNIKLDKEERNGVTYIDIRQRSLVDIMSSQIQQDIDNQIVKKMTEIASMNQSIIPIKPTYGNTLSDVINPIYSDWIDTDVHEPKIVTPNCKTVRSILKVLGEKFDPRKLLHWTLVIALASRNNYNTPPLQRSNLWMEYAVQRLTKRLEPGMTVRLRTSTGGTTGCVLLSFRINLC